MITLELGHIDWNRPIIWMNSLLAENDQGMRYWPCRLVSTNMGLSEDKSVAVLYEEKGKDQIGYVNSFGYFKKESASVAQLAQRVVWNYQGTLPDISDVNLLGEM